MPISPAIPNADSLYDAFLYNWKTLLTASPATFGMVAGDATAISTQYTNWHSAYILASDVPNRTPAIVAAKNYQKALSLILLRQQYMLIKANPSVLDEDKTAIGVRVTDPVPTPIPPPTTAPVLTAINNAPLTMLLDAHDSDTPTTRRKPAGVIGLQLVRKIGVTPETDPDNCTLMGLYSRFPVSIGEFAPSDAGKYATFFACWTNAKGQEGPWSAARTQIIAN